LLYHFKIIMLLNYILFPVLFKGQPAGSIHDFTARGIEGNTVDFKVFKGKKILIVNTASECGFTPQLKDLEELYQKYNDKLVVIGFPSNDFGRQEPGSNTDIKSFCERNYSVTFPLMQKISVKGDSIHPIYQWLTSKKENGVMDSKVKWNFQKYLIDENGHLVDVVSPWRKPGCRRIQRWITKQ
jgi:glutathione peroxidase